jgi:hypothetical protein
VNQNFNQLQVRFPGLGCWLFILGAVWIISAIGIGGILKSIFAIVVLVFLAPILGFLALQFWLKRNVVNGNCPVCEQSLVGLKASQMSCLNCGTELSVTETGFERFASNGIIDIQAVDVQSTGPSVNIFAGPTAEDDDSDVIDVEVQKMTDS